MQHVLAKPVKVAPVKTLAAGGGAPATAGVGSAGVDQDRLGLLNRNANDLEVLHPPRLELVVNEQLPRAGLQAFPLGVGAARRRRIPRSPGGAEQRGSLLAIGLQLSQNNHGEKRVPEDVNVLVLIVRCNA